MDWQTFVISILGSGAVTALVNGFMNHRTQVRAIRESGLYTKRAEVLDATMNKMAKLHMASGELVSLFQHDGSSDAEKLRRKKVAHSFSDFFEYYNGARHYLPKELSDEIENLCNEYRELIIDFSHDAHPLNSAEPKNTVKWLELMRKHQKGLKEKTESIADEFRRMIGVK